MSRYEVLVASTAPGLVDAVELGEDGLLHRHVPNTASTTTSASQLQCVVGGGPPKRAITAALASALRRPLATRPS